MPEEKQVHESTVPFCNPTHCGETHSMPQMNHVTPDSLLSLDALLKAAELVERILLNPQ